MTSQQQKVSSNPVQYYSAPLVSFPPVPSSSFVAEEGGQPHHTSLYLQEDKQPYNEWPTPTPTLQAV